MIWPVEIEVARVLDQLERTLDEKARSRNADPTGVKGPAAKSLQRDRPHPAPPHLEHNRPAARSPSTTLHALGREQRVAPRELFFDLVFVFAFTQVMMLLGNDPTFAGIGQSVLVLAALWWVWVLYASLTNSVSPDNELVGVALLAGLIAIFIAALAVPHVFGDDGALFGAAFLFACMTPVAIYAISAREHRDLHNAVLRLAPWNLVSTILILIAGVTDSAQPELWVTALAFAYIGATLSGSTGWALHPAHLAERYGLVIILALGEAFISLGISAAGTQLEPAAVVAVVLGLLVAASFWFSYFDFFSLRGARILGELRGAERVAFARDVYVYAHFPMIVGIVLYAAAMKHIVVHIGEHLNSAEAFALCGGSAIYLLTYSVIRTRSEHRLTLSRGRFVAAVTFFAVLPVAQMIPALAALGLVTTVWLVLHAYELLWWREARAASQSQLPFSGATSL
jgi:low temperature requirement protein LtrA